MRKFVVFIILLALLSGCGTINRTFKGGKHLDIFDLTKKAIDTAL